MSERVGHQVDDAPGDAKLSCAGHQKWSPPHTAHPPAEQADKEEMLNNKARQTGCWKSWWWNLGPQHPSPGPYPLGCTGLVLMLDGQQDLGSDPILPDAPGSASLPSLPGKILNWSAILPLWEAEEEEGAPWSCAAIYSCGDKNTEDEHPPWIQPWDKSYLCIKGKSSASARAAASTTPACAKFLFHFVPSSRGLKRVVLQDASCCFVHLD